MSDNGRAVIIGAIMKRGDEPFKLKHISQSTGLPRQNCMYHLNKLTDSAFLEKQGTTYVISDRERLVDALVSASEAIPQQRAVDTIILTSMNPTNINRAMSLIVNARALDLPGSIEVKAAMTEELNASIKSLMQAKKWMTAYTPTYMSARRFVRRDTDTYIGDYYNLFDALELEVPCSRIQLSDKVTDSIEFE